MYDGTWLEIVDAHMGQARDLLRLRKFRPEAIAVANLACCIDLMSHGIASEIEKTVALMKKTLKTSGLSPRKVANQRLSFNFMERYDTAVAHHGENQTF